MHLVIFVPYSVTHCLVLVSSLARKSDLEIGSGWKCVLLDRTELTDKKECTAMLGKWEECVAQCAWAH